MVLRRLTAAVLALTVGVVVATAPSSLAGPTRTKTSLPYGRYSIWNMPLGQNAKYVDFKIEDFGWVAQWQTRPAACGGMTIGVNNAPSQPGCNVWVRDRLNLGLDVNYVAYAKGDDPWRKLPDGTSIQVPASFSVFQPTAAAPNNSSAIIAPAGSITALNYTQASVNGLTVSGTLINQPWVWQSKPTLSAWLTDQQIGGEGKWGGHGGSALSAHGGNIHAGELTSDEPIRHALAIDLPTANYPNCVADGYRWPALVRDGAGCWQNAPTGDLYGSYRGSQNGMPSGLRMGALIALKPTASCEGYASKPVRKVCAALRDYGAYVVDTTGWQSIDINVDQGVGDEIYGGKPGSPWGARPVYSELLHMYTSQPWAVVDDNGPATIGGAGVRRTCLAPPFSDGTIDLTSGNYVEPAGCGSATPTTAANTVPSTPAPTQPSTTPPTTVTATTPPTTPPQTTRVQLWRDCMPYSGT